MSGQWTRIRYPPRGQPSQGAPSVRQRPTNYRNSALSSVRRWPNRVVVYTVDRSLGKCAHYYSDQVVGATYDWSRSDQWRAGE